MSRLDLRSLLSTMSRLFSLVVLLLLGTQLAHAERKTTYFHTDGLGSVVAASDDSGNLLWRKEYAPYGEQLDSTSENEKLAYTGKEHDDVTGLTYFGARYYDPHLGRFMGIDPAGIDLDNPFTFNRYAYGNSNPYRFVDPDGREIYDVKAEVLRNTFGHGTSGKGHHWVPFGSVNGPDMDLSNEARVVFGQSVSGAKLTSYDHNLSEHPSYNGAVRQELKTYAQRNGIELSRMTTEQANKFVEHVKASDIKEIAAVNSRVTRYTEKAMRWSGRAGRTFFWALASVGIVDYAEQTISTQTAACRATNCAYDE